MLANDILPPDGLLGCHTAAVKKQKRTMSVSQHHSALNWHLHVLELKGGGKGYSLHFLQPKDVSPLKDFHHNWAVQLPRLRNTETPGPLEQEGHRAEVRRDF